MATKPTKTDKIRRLLSRPSGATIAQLEKATGWQSHSVRAALTGLRKQGRAVVREKNANDVTTYRIDQGTGQ